MAYFIFLKDLDNIYGTISRIAENESDLNNLNIIKTDYKIIENSQTNFDLVKYGTKYPSKYNNDNIIIISHIQLHGVFIQLICCSFLIICCRLIN